MPEILLAEEGRLRLLPLLQRLLTQMPKRRQRQLPRRKQLRSPKQNLMLLLYYHHLSRNNIQKEKGKEEKESRSAEVPVLVRRRRFLVTSISSRSLARRGKIVNIATVKRLLMLARAVDPAKGVVKRQEDSLQQTRPRRSTNHAGTGLRGSVDMVTSATNDAMPICSTRPRTLDRHRQKRLLHFYMMTVMWMNLPSRLHPTW